MSERNFKIGDRVRFKTESQPRIATVVEVLDGGWLVLQWAGTPPTTSSCDSGDVILIRAAAAPRK